MRFSVKALLFYCIVGGWAFGSTISAWRMYYRVEQMTEQLTRARGVLKMIDQRFTREEAFDPNRKYSIIGGPGFVVPKNKTLKGPALIIGENFGIIHIPVDGFIQNNGPGNIILWHGNTAAITHRSSNAYFQGLVITDAYTAFDIRIKE